MGYKSSGKPRNMVAPILGFKPTVFRFVADPCPLPQITNAMRALPLIQIVRYVIDSELGSSNGGYSPVLPKHIPNFTFAKLWNNHFGI